jgi:hypothetical protein
VIKYDVEGEIFHSIDLKQDYYEKKVLELVKLHEQYLPVLSDFPLHLHNA